MNDLKTGSTDPESPDFVGVLSFQGSPTPPPYTLTFYNHSNEKVGSFNFSTSPATFEGEVTESAKCFVEAVVSHFENYYKPQLKTDLLNEAWKRINANLLWYKDGYINWQELERILKGL